MIINKLGTFLFVVGVIILIVFIGSVIVENAQFGPFFVALVLMAWGIYWMRRRKEQPESSNRFGLIQRFNRKEQNPQDKG